MISKSAGKWLAAVLFSAVALPTLAHHSFATFDMTKQYTITGTVKEFQWQNPHIWIHLIVKDGEQTQEWEVEGGSLVLLKREGWSKDTFKPGDKVSITIHPKRDGSLGGSFVEGITADGKKLGMPNDKQVTATPTSP